MAPAFIAIPPNIHTFPWMSPLVKCSCSDFLNKSHPRCVCAELERSKVDPDLAIPWRFNIGKRTNDAVLIEHIEQALAQIGIMTALDQEPIYALYDGQAFRPVVLAKPKQAHAKLGELCITCCRVEACILTRYVPARLLTLR